MLVIKIPDGEHVTIFDRLDGASPPIKIVSNGSGSIGIEADPRYCIQRSNAKNKMPMAKGGKDARPVSA